jgi:heterodisulfide reductase subunit B
MCNVNLEVYQRQVNREYGTDFSIPAMYFTQLLGVALGLAPDRLGIGKELVAMAPTMLFSKSEEAGDLAR